MKVGDVVRFVWGLERLGKTGVVISTPRHGMNRTFVDVLIDGQIIGTDWRALKVINESR